MQMLALWHTFSALFLLKKKTAGGWQKACTTLQPSLHDGTHAREALCLLVEGSHRPVVAELRGVPQQVLLAEQEVAAAGALQPETQNVHEMRS